MGDTRTLPFPVAQGLAEVDRQGPRLNGLDAVPGSLGVAGGADDGRQPGGVVLVVGVVGRGRAAGGFQGREALGEEAQVLGVVGVVGVGGLRDVDQLANQGMSAGWHGGRSDGTRLTRRFGRRCAPRRRAAS